LRNNNQVYSLLLAVFLAISMFSGFARLANGITKDGPKGRPDRKPNVLFIAVDDLKPILGCYGQKEAKTPSIDAFAKQGTVFLNAHCQWPVCGGSRASLMTGLRPEAVGVLDLKTNMRAKNPNVVSLAQLFRINGYETAAAGKIYDPRCVDSKQDYDKPSWSIPFQTIQHSKLKDGKTKQVAIASEYEDEKLSDGWIRNRGIALMNKLNDSDKPFFLAVGFKKPHLPFVAPKKYWDLYDANELPLAKHQGGIVDASGYSIHSSSEFRGYEGVPATGPFPEALQRKSNHGYFACVSFIDAQIGMLLDELEKLELNKNTIVVIWGDHGFHLGDHGIYGKHSTLENASRVPLIVRVPGKKQINKSRMPAELSDLFPTLAKLAELENVPDVNGRDISAALTDANAKVREGALTVFKSQGCLGYSFRTNRYRYTEWVNKKGKTKAKELFDYEKDPLETKNLADTSGYAEIQKKLAVQIRSHAEGCERLFGGEGSAPKTEVKADTTSAGLEAVQYRGDAIQDIHSGEHPPIRSVSNAATKNKVLIGAAFNAKNWGSDSEAVLNREFDYVTPGNGMKQAAIHPEPSTWKWKKADEWVARCKREGQIMRLHAAISPQCSKWAKTDDRTPAELETNLREYVTEFCKRYNGKPHIRWMDVVNETVSRNGEWFGPRAGNEKWENPWPRLGYDNSHELKPPRYIKLAFELANKHAPNIKQLVNQHGGMEPEMWDKVKALIEYLQDQGIRVDGLGWQAHIDTGFEKDPKNLAALRSLIEWSQKRKLEFHVTEFNAWIKKQGKDKKVTPEDLEAQAKTYRAILDVLDDYADKGVITWCAWRIQDDQTQRSQLRGNLFDANTKPKPGFGELQDFVHGK
jgi:arylsulfatase A-like enzyme/GH35 family endo-1,4-beta-xylanase